MARALVTGCSSGIGRATAVELTSRGFEVIATARRLASIEDLDVKARFALDVDSDASVADVRREVGPVDVLVNNAGLGLDGAVEVVPLGDARRIFETNFFGAVRMIQSFLPAMREQGSGTVVNVTSVAGIAAGPLAGFYSASKFALEALSESLHVEVGHFGVKVLIVEPGAIETRFGENLLDHRWGDGPYRPLADLWTAASDKLGGGQPAPGPELVATRIADALEHGNPPLRLPVGADAELVVAARGVKPYEEFESLMREALQIDW